MKIWHFIILAIISTLFAIVALGSTIERRAAVNKQFCTLETQTVEALASAINTYPRAKAISDPNGYELGRSENMSFMNQLVKIAPCKIVFHVIPDPTRR